jgi:hypothetical protein
MADPQESESERCWKCGCLLAYPTPSHLLDCPPAPVETDWVAKIVTASKAFVAEQHGTTVLWADLAEHLVKSLGLREIRPAAERAQPYLGLATTAQLLDEIRARIDHDYFAGGGGLDYTTVDGRPKYRRVGRTDG